MCFTFILFYLIFRTFPKDIFLASFNRFNEDEQRWIIIGAGLSALLLLALIQLLCMFCSCGCGCCKNNSEQEDYLDEKVDFNAKKMMLR